MVRMEAAVLSVIVTICPLEILIEIASDVGKSAASTQFVLSDEDC
jgi:hypothetical protein